MRFKRLKIRNVRSYKEAEFIFPEGSILLAGDVGSGKTSILLAIEYALFGLQPGQRGAGLLRNGAEYGEVSLELELDGKSIIIERRLKRGHRTINNDYSAIIIEGEKEESSITEIKARIIELLNYPAEFIKKTNLLYRFTVYTPQEEMKQIILEDAESRLNIIRHIFGIDKYKRIRENLQILSANLKEEIKLLQYEIKDIEEYKTRLKSNEIFIELINKKIEDRERSLKTALEKTRKIEEELDNIESKIKEGEKYDKEIDKATIMFMSKKDQLALAEKDIVEIKKGLENIEIFNNEDYNKIIDWIELAKNELEELHNKYIEISARISSLHSRKNEDLEKRARIFKIDICPVCLQSVPEAHKHNIMLDTEKEIKSISNQLEESEKFRKIVSEEIENKKKSLADLEQKKAHLEAVRLKFEEMKKMKEKLAKLENNRASLVLDIDFLEKQMSKLKEEILKLSGFSNIYKMKKDELRKALDEEKKEEIGIAELRKEMQMTKNEIAKLEIEIDKKMERGRRLNEILELNDWLSNDFAGLIEFTERNIMMKLKQEFSRLFSQWFNMLAEGLDAHLDENFTPVLMQGEHELDYSYLSGGERTAVALAYRLALNQTINSVLSKIKTRDIVILDEPTDGFSEQQLDKMRDVFEELNVGQLVIVSHEAKIEGFVDNVIRLKKAGGVSGVEA